MDKQEERRVLNYVFGRVRAFAVTDSEQPDFICKRDPSFSFGVEVAEFYFSESVAPLRRIKGYANELLSNQTYRHRDDKWRIPVRNVTYRSGKTGQEIPLKAIASEGYTVAEVIRRFCDLIRAKNTKHGEYERRICTIDLLIHDVDSILRNYSIEDWMRAIDQIEARDCITQSQFREIYVVTGHERGKRICVPLRAALFVTEVFALQTMFKEFHANTRQDVTFGQYVQALAAYLVGRFDGIDYELDEDRRLSFVFASVAVCYGENGGLQVRDISCEHGDKRKKLSDELDGALDEEFAQYVKLERPRMFCCAPLEFEAYEANNDRT